MNGLVLIDKPADFTSFDVVAVMRKVLGTRKIGHTGTLDPMATGVLPLLVGSATKLCDILPVSDKAYRAVIRFGVETDTQDLTGRILSQDDRPVTPEQVRALIPRFVGAQMQVPPMVSAVSVGGVRLYDLARQGKTVEREARPITVYAIDYMDGDPDSRCYTLQIACSKGTYIRALAHDMGRALGCGAALKELRRTEACGFSLDDCITLSDAKTRSPEQLLLPVEAAVVQYPRVTVTDAQAKRFENGGALDLERLPLSRRAAGFFRVAAPNGRLLGIGAADADSGVLRLRCLL